MEKVKGRFVPRTIDRAMFAILATLHGAAALYVIGPWYLAESEAALYNIFNDPKYVQVYGFLLFLDAIALFYASAGRGAKYTLILSNALLFGFLLRLYALIGVFLALEDWRPPSYLSHVATILIAGSYWVYVQVNKHEGLA